MTKKQERERRIRRKKLSALAAALLVALFTLGLYLHSRGVAVLNPAGQVAGKERTLMVEAVLLGLIVIVPVYILTVVIAWKYRENNSSGKKYSPDWDHSRWLEGFWWAIPLTIITILSVITWRSSYALDPFKALNSTAKPLTVEVVALDWKWLFIYPEQKIASVNQVQIPVDTPVTFDITSDTVMNSFWIPRLGGQIYAMTGMSTQLHLIAGKVGTYSGSSANISGSGFAGMAFTAKAEPQTDFTNWVSVAQKSQNKLTLDAYNKLARPSKTNSISTYSLSSNNLYDYIVMKYMEPGAGQ